MTEVTSSAKRAINSGGHIGGFNELIAQFPKFTKIDEEIWDTEDGWRHCYIFWCGKFQSAVYDTRYSEASIINMMVRDDIRRHGGMKSMMRDALSNQKSFKENEAEKQREEFHYRVNDVNKTFGRHTV